MLIYLLRRVALTIPTFLALMFLTFLAIRLVPGDPVEVRMGERGVAPERLALLRHQLGLDQPVWKQFLDYAGHIFRGDFGVSLATQNTVLGEFLTLFPATLELSFFAMLFAMIVGVPAGALAAARRGGVFDQTLMTVSLFGYSMPIFWWGLVLVMFFSVTLDHVLPVSGRLDLINYSYDTPTGFMLIDAALSDQPGAVWDAARHLILPAIVLGTVPLGIIARMTRSSMLEVLGEDYVRTARAKGLAPGRVVGVHALRNAMLPVVTVIGLSVSELLAGAVLTEYIFSWPGIGSWLVQSIYRRDYPALQGGLLLVSSVVILVNLAVDLVYGLIDPGFAMPADVALAEKETAPPSPFGVFAAAYAENRGALIGLAVLALIAAAAVFAEELAPHSPVEQFREFVRAKPVWAGGTWAFPLGTDGDGRDMLSRLIFGARISLFIGIAVMGFAFVIGVGLGLTAAMAGSIADVLITRVMDVIMAMPSLVLAIIIVAILGPSLVNTIVAVTIVGLPRYTRIARASALGELPKDYVIAARVAGVGPLRLALTCVLPNALAPLIVQAALGVSDAILEAAALGFLGLGAQPPTPEWGAMLADSREFIRSDPWIVTLPGLAILITVVAINLAGDGLRDALDPKMRRG